MTIFNHYSNNLGGIGIIITTYDLSFSLANNYVLVQIIINISQQHNNRFPNFHLCVDKKGDKQQGYMRLIANVQNILNYFQKYVTDPMTSGDNYTRNEQP